MARKVLNGVIIFGAMEKEMGKIMTSLNPIEEGYGRKGQLVCLSGWDCFFRGVHHSKKGQMRWFEWWTNFIVQKNNLKIKSQIKKIF